MSPASQRERLELLLELGPGLVVLTTSTLREGQALVAELGARWGVAAVGADAAFAELEGRARVVWDLAFLAGGARRRALIKLNRARDRLASLAAPVVLWLHEDDLALAWELAQDLLDWAREILAWSAGEPASSQQPALEVLPPQEPRPALPTLVEAHVASLDTAIAAAGARAWVEVGASLPAHVAWAFAHELVARGWRVVLYDLERGDRMRALEWLGAIDGEVVLVLVGGFMAHEALPARLRALVFVRQAAYPPPGWRALTAFGPQPELEFAPWFAPLPSLRARASLALDHRLEPQLGLELRADQLASSIPGLEPVQVVTPEDEP